MPLENMIQTFKTNEKEMLVESMEKLIDHIYEKRSNQEEIFKSLSLNDLDKMFKNMLDPSQALRKTSIRFLCELLYDNYSVQTLFCELTGIVPMKGKICINKIPDSFLHYYKELPELLDSLKNISDKENLTNPLCWFCNPEKIHLKADGIEYIYPKSEDFVDPLVCLIGFIIKNEHEEFSQQESMKFTEFNTNSEQGQGQMKIANKIKKPESALNSKSKSPFNKNSPHENPKNSNQSQIYKAGVKPRLDRRLKEECNTARPFDKNVTKTTNEIYYKTAEKTLNVEVQKISLINNTDTDNINISDIKEQSRNKNITSYQTTKKKDLSNQKTRLLSPQIITNKKTSGLNFASTSYHMAAPLLKTPNPKKNNDIRKQNNFMSIIETKSKDENKPNPKSQSVLQDYNIKYEKKSSEPVSKKTDVENTKVKPLNKFIEQINYRTEQHYKTDEKYFRKEEKENSKMKLFNDSFGKYNNDIKNSIEIEEKPDIEFPEERFYNDINMVQRNTSIINTPRINDYNPQKEKENILFVRKSHELGLSYCNQHIKKQSYENPINKSNITQNLEKDKKSPIASSLAVTKSKNRNVITPNSNKPKENRSLTPNTKEQIKFEGKIKKSVQRQFLKTSEKDDNKTTTFRKK